MHTPAHSHSHASNATNAQAPQTQTVLAADDERHILAERFKTKMCRNYINSGACPYEARCMFAHGDDDLRTTEMNIRDGLFTEEAIKGFKRAHRLLQRSKTTTSNAPAHMPPQYDALYSSGAVEPPRYHDYHHGYPQQQQQQHGYDHHFDAPVEDQYFDNSYTHNAPHFDVYALDEFRPATPEAADSDAASSVGEPVSGAASSAATPMRYRYDPYNAAAPKVLVRAPSRAAAAAGPIKTVALVDDVDCNNDVVCP